MWRVATNIALFPPLRSRPISATAKSAFTTTPIQWPFHQASCDLLTKTSLQKLPSEFSHFPSIHSVHIWYQNIPYLLLSLLFISKKYRAVCISLGRTFFSFWSERHFQQLGSPTFSGLRILRTMLKAKQTTANAGRFVLGVLTGATGYGVAQYFTHIDEDIHVEYQEGPSCKYNDLKGFFRANFILSPTATFSIWDVLHCVFYESLQGQFMHEGWCHLTPSKHLSSAIWLVRRPIVISVGEQTGGKLNITQQQSMGDLSFFN